MTNEELVRLVLMRLFGNQVVAGQHMWFTARRVIEYWRSLQPVQLDVLDSEFTVFSDDPPSKQLIACSNIPFHSACAHHLLPFEGRVHIGYKPNHLLCGLSKFPRAVNHFAQRPQTQELFTRDLADYLYTKLSPQSLVVRVVATHTCTTCRGVVAPGTVMVTDVVLGDAARYSELKQEFLDMIHEKERT